MLDNLYSLIAAAPAPSSSFLRTPRGGSLTCGEMAEGVGRTHAQVLAALPERQAAFKRPKRVLFVNDLPRNPLGKVRKAALRETDKDLYSC